MSQSLQIPPNQSFVKGVTSINGLQGAVTFSQGANIILTKIAQNIQIASTATIGGGMGDWKYLVRAKATDPTKATVYDTDNNIVAAEAETGLNINWAYSNLTAGRSWIEKIKLLGYMTPAISIVPQKYSWLQGHYQKISEIAAHPLFINPNRGSNDDAYIKITDLLCDGGDQNINAIDFQNAGGSGSDGGLEMWEFSRLGFQRFGNTNLKLRGFSVQVKISDIWGGHAGAYGLDAQVSDASLSLCLWDGGTYGASVTSMAGLRVSDQYVNQGVFLQGYGYGNVIDNIISDNQSGKTGIEIASLKWSKISGLWVRVLGNGDTTHDAVKLTGSSHDNTVSDVVACSDAVTTSGGTGTSKWAYAIEEEDATCDYNIYHTVNGHDCVSGALRQLGVNGKPRSATDSSIIGAIALI